jgi:signal transduction histidine kinase
MKRESVSLARQYGTALRRHLKLSSPLSLRLARAVGRQAAAIGLRALDLARIHDQALATLQLPITRDGTLNDPDAFFAAAFAPLEHRDALRKGSDDSANLLAESCHLKQCLGSLTRRVLTAQELERATISRSLHDDVAQTLLGIQVRLAHLKKEAARKTQGLKKQIAATQRLVGQSAKTLERFARRLSTQ